LQPHAAAEALAQASEASSESGVKLRRMNIKAAACPPLGGQQ